MSATRGEKEIKNFSSPSFVSKSGEKKKQKSSPIEPTNGRRKKETQQLCQLHTEKEDEAERAAQEKANLIKY
jgi:hypothetical protein